MRPFMLDAGEVGRLATEALGRAGLTVSHHPVGFGNENWEVADRRGGERYVLKVSPRDSASKWRSSHRAYELAASVGVPVPELVHLGEHGDHLVRIFTWIEGRSPRGIAGDPERSRRFLSSVGDAVRALHTIELDAFSSRLDGSAASFAGWKDYVDHRLGQIRQRCEAIGAVEPHVLDQAGTAITRLADEVEGSVRPVLCHRDLHADNVVVADDGTLDGVIDWDAAEAWDAAGDWFKLEWMLLRDHPGEEHVLVDAYLKGAPEPSRWRDRKLLVHLLETLNLIPNAVSRNWDPAFESRARAHLADLLVQADTSR